MLKALSLSIRNLSRYRTRTIITIVAVIISVMISIVIDGFLRGVFNMSLYNLLNYESSEVSIYKEGYFKKRNEYPNDILIEREELEALYKELNNLNIPYAPRYKTPVDIVFFSDKEQIDLEYSSILIGVEPDFDKDVFKVSSFVSDGKWMEKGEDGVVVGSKIAEKLGLDVGSFLTLQASGREGFLETFDEEVIGIVNTENPEVNSSQVFIDLSTLDDYLYLQDGVTELDLSDGLLSIAPKAFSEKISDIVEPMNLEAYYYEEVNEDLMAIMNGDKGSSYLILIVLFVVAAAGISNTMLMAIMERQKESGMLRALGFSNSRVNLIFILEGAFTGFIGAIIGALLGVIILYPMTVYGIDLSFVFSSDMDIGYRIPMIMRAGIFWQSFLIIPVIAVILSILSSLLPVIHSGRCEIAVLFRRS